MALHKQMIFPDACKQALNFGFFRIQVWALLDFTSLLCRSGLSLSMWLVRM